MILLQAVINDLFSPSTFATLAGATGVVYVVSGAIQRVFNFSPKWFALVLSIVVSFVALTIVPLDPKVNDWIEYLIAFLNGFLIYMTATGTNQLTAPTKGPSPNNVGPQRRKFRANWLK